MALADKMPAGAGGSDAQSTASGSGGAGRRYKKRNEQKQERDGGLTNPAADVPISDEEESQADVDTQEVRLVQLDPYAIDKAKMANVFGGPPEDSGPVSSSLRLNPLVHDPSGRVVVPTDQAQRAWLRGEDSASQDSEETARGTAAAAAATKGKKGTYKRPKKAVGADDDDKPTVEDGQQGPKINYSKNFRFKQREENGAAGGKKTKKLTSFGVVMPSRVKGNTLPKNQLVAAGGPSQYALSSNGQPSVNKADLEAANRRREMRRRWRYVIILILIILFFGLILTVVLYFATQAP